MLTTRQAIAISVSATLSTIGVIVAVTSTEYAGVGSLLIAVAGMITMFVYCQHNR